MDLITPGGVGLVLMAYIGWRLCRWAFNKYFGDTVR